MKIEKIKIFLLLFLALWLSNACNHTPNSTQDTQTPTSQKVTIKRFDRAINTLTEGNFDQNTKTLAQKYPELYPIYVQIVPQMSQDTSLDANLKLFVKNPYIKTIFGDVDSVFSDVWLLETQFQNAFERYNTIFPNQPLPQIVALVSTFQQQNVQMLDQTLYVPLDMFLGRQYPFYKTIPNVSAYQIKRFEANQILPNSIREWIKPAVLPSKNGNLLGEMIYHGKIIYLTKQILPQVSDSLLLHFTAAQIQWANANEGQIWASVIENQTLYSIDKLNIAKYINDAPFMSGFPNAAPPMLGRWIGFQIVKKYIEKTNADPKTLLLQTDEQKILTQSGYKPKINP